MGTDADTCRRVILSTSENRKHEKGALARGDVDTPIGVISATTSARLCRKAQIDMPSEVARISLRGKPDYEMCRRSDAVAIFPDLRAYQKRRRE